MEITEDRLRQVIREEIDTFMANVIKGNAYSKKITRFCLNAALVAVLGIAVVGIVIIWIIMLRT